jgi:hypothetical protein
LEVNNHHDLNEYSLAFLRERGFAPDGFGSIGKDGVKFEKGGFNQVKEAITGEGNVAATTRTTYAFSAPDHTQVRGVLDAFNGISFRIARNALENDMGVRAARLAQQIYEKGGHNSPEMFERIFDSVLANIKAKSGNAHRAFVAGALIGNGSPMDILKQVADLPTINSTLDHLFDNSEQYLSKLQIKNQIGANLASLPLSGVKLLKHQTMMFTGFIGESATKGTQHLKGLYDNFKAGRMKHQDYIDEVGRAVVHWGLLGVSGTTLGGMALGTFKVIDATIQRLQGKEEITPNKYAQMVETLNGYNMIMGDKYIDTKKLSLDPTQNLSLLVGNLSKTIQFLPVVLRGEYKDNSLFASFYRNSGRLIRTLGEIGHIENLEDARNIGVDLVSELGSILMAGATSNVRNGLATQQGRIKAASAETMHDLIWGTDSAVDAMNIDEQIKMGQDLMFRAYKFAAVFGGGLRESAAGAMNDQYKQESERALEKGDILGSITNVMNSD